MNEQTEYPQLEQSVQEFLDILGENVPVGSWVSRNMSLLESERKNKGDELQFLLEELLKFDYLIQNYESEEILSSMFTRQEINDFKRIGFSYLAMQKDVQEEIIAQKQEELRRLYESVQVTVDLASILEEGLTSESFETELNSFKEIIQNCALYTNFGILFRVKETRQVDDGKIYQTFVFYLTPSFKH